MNKWPIPDEGCLAADAGGKRDEALDIGEWVYTFVPFVVRILAGLVLVGAMFFS